ncbi:hypothetical protein Pelo_17032 [Pelomyxa schiedti]|nr:hypothetical protein Pelo_17032 [Pelomyxa schiedti]
MAATNASLPVVFRVDPSRSVSSQFHSLTMLAHPRCGRGRPGARALGRGRCVRGPLAIAGPWLAVAIKLVWDWVCNEAPVRVVDVRVSRGWEYSRRRRRPDTVREFEGLFTIGVSDATLGLMTSVTRHWVRDTNKGFVRLVGATDRFFVECTKEPHSRKWYSAGSTYFSQRTQTAPGTGGKSDCGKVLLGQDGLSRCMNHKWLVIQDTEQDWTHSETVVAIANLTEQQLSLKYIHSVADKLLIGVFFDECNCDEALFVFEDHVIAVVCVVNLPQLWSSSPSEPFSPISTTRCARPKSHSSLDWRDLNELLVMHTESNRRSFIASVPHGWKRDIFEVLRYIESSSEPAATPHNEEVLSTSKYGSQRNLELSQLRVGVFEIWDCNMPSHPLRVVECVKDTGCRQMMYGHAGFLFHINENRILVTDYLTGAKVAMLTCHSEKPDENNEAMNTLQVVTRVYPSLSTSSQFHSLMMMTHPRCGRGRPGARARGRGRCVSGPLAIAGPWLAVAIKLVWHWVCNDAPFRVINVRVSRGILQGKWRIVTEWEALFTIGVSAATLGLMASITRHCVRDTNKGFVQLVGANDRFVIDSADERLSERWFSGGTLYIRDLNGWIADQGAHGGKVVLCQNGLGRSMNHKWLVLTDLEDERGEPGIIVLANLAEQQVVPKYIRSVADKYPLGVFIDEYHCDEALIVFFLDDKVAELCVVSLPQLWSSSDSDPFIPISTTRCVKPRSLSSDWTKGDKWIVMHPESNSRSFIARAGGCRYGRWAYGSMAILRYLESSSGPYATPHNDEEVLNTSLYPSQRNLELSQLSERLYCVSGQNIHNNGVGVFEIWDCNMPSHPLRVVECVKDTTCDQMLYAHAGFLFHFNENRILVTDYETGAKVAMLTCRTEGKKFPPNHTGVSFLL